MSEQTRQWPYRFENRYDFVYFFDITDGNPNGDPDAGNLPRIDPETGQGLVTDVCLKRKIRNFVGLTHGEKPPFEIYVKEKAVLNQQHERAYVALKIDPKKRSSKGKDKAEEDRRLTRWMCDNFFDIRAFGAVMTTDVNCGQVRGPIQFGLARSTPPDRQQRARRDALRRHHPSARPSSRRAAIAPWAASSPCPTPSIASTATSMPNLASGPNGTGFSEEDLGLFKRALDQMFECDRSAARANMRPVACVAFRHESPLGNARADRLFSRVQCRPEPGVQPLPGEADGDGEGRPPRSFADYELTIDEENLPDGVTIERWIDWA